MDKQKNYKLILHILITVICVSVFYYITVRTKPYPFSDFLYYWDYATNLPSYIKGGLLFLFYSPLKLLGLQPYTSAFIVNSICFVALSYSMWIGTKSKWQVFSSILLLLIGIWFLGFIPIVNTDIPTIALFIFGIRIFLLYLEIHRTPLLILSIFIMAISLSMRSQLLYISILLVGIILVACVYQLFKKRKLGISLKFFLLFLSASTFISLGSTKYLEVQSQNTVGLSIHKRVTFYTGILNTPSFGIGCGAWNSEAVQQTEKDLNLPLSKAIVSHIKQIPTQQLTETILCKWRNYIFDSNDSGLAWLEGHITNGWTEAKVYGNLWKDFRYIEYFSAQVLKLTSLGLVLLFIVNIKKYTKIEIFSFGITLFAVLMFFLIHTILEIQPRYIIPPVLISLTMLLNLHGGLIKKEK